MKDASKQILGDLITFIYTGEVKVKDRNLNDFLSFAKALEIKGLGDGDYSRPTDPLALNSESSVPTLSVLQYQSSQTLRVQYSPANSKNIPEMSTVTQHPKQSESISHHQQGDFDEMNENGFRMNNNHNDNGYHMAYDRLFLDQYNDALQDADDQNDSDDDSIIIISPKKKRTKQNQGNQSSFLTYIFWWRYHFP